MNTNERHIVNEITIFRTTHLLKLASAGSHTSACPPLQVSRAHIPFKGVNKKRDANNGFVCFAAGRSFCWKQCPVGPNSTTLLCWRVWEGFHNGIHWSHSSSTSLVMFRTACLKHPTISGDVWQSVLRTDNQTYCVTRKFCGVLTFAILPAISKNITSNKQYRKHLSPKNLLHSKYSLT